MPMISVRDNKNSRWKRKEKTKTKRNKGVAQTIVKVWELTDFVVRLN